MISGFSATVPRPALTRLRRMAGAGSLELARGTSHLADGTVELRGERHIFGVAFDTRSWAPKSLAGTSWSGGTFNASAWTGATWSGRMWSGRMSSGRVWSTGLYS